MTPLLGRPLCDVHCKEMATGSGEKQERGRKEEQQQDDNEQED